MRTGLPSEYEYKRSIAVCDAVIRRGFALMYPDVVDPARLSEIQPEDFEVLEQVYADAQRQANEEKAGKTKKKGFFERAKEYLHEHPTLCKAVKYGSAAAMLFLMLAPAIGKPVTAASLPSLEHLKNSGYSTNNQLINLVQEGRNATADGVVSDSELLSLRAHAGSAYENITVLNAVVGEGSGIENIVNEINAYAADAKVIADKGKPLGDAYQIFQNVNASMAKFDNFISMLSGTDNITMNNELGQAIGWFVSDAKNFGEVYNVTVSSYDPSLGENFCHNLLKNLESPAFMMSQTRKYLANETAGLVIDTENAYRCFKNNNSLTADAASLAVEKIDYNLNSQGNPYWTAPPQPTFWETATSWPWYTLWWAPAMGVSVFLLAKSARALKEELPEIRFAKKRKKARGKVGTDWDDECI